MAGADGWFEPVRAYCERLDGSFWAEPLNAGTNLAFLAASAAALHRAVRAGDRTGGALALLVGVVGIGSFLFHTLAVRWSMLADVIPIALFIHAYFLVAMRRFLGLGAAAAVGATLVFAAFGFVLVPALEASFPGIGEATNGSLDYLPALLALGGVAASLAPRDGAAARRLLGIAGLFLGSLAARTLDRAACGSLPTGTHGVWHVLNAAVLYGLVALAIEARTARRAAPAPGA
ncbi:ceramidase domain-containing protein [Methylobacterium sp. A54F]